MSLRGISQKTLYVHNPLPPITSKELCERSGVKGRNVPDRDHFRLVWEYGGGIEKEWLIVECQGFALLRESETRSFLRENREKGMVILSNPYTEQELLEKSIEGCEKAEQFYRERGMDRVDAYQAKHGDNDEQMRRKQRTLWKWYQNEAAADVIAEHRENLQNALDDLLTAPKRQAS